MEEIAWRLRSTNGKPSNNLGFVGGAQIREIESEEEEIAPAANDSTPLRK
jgi:hypothetical protein